MERGSALTMADRLRPLRFFLAFLFLILLPSCATTPAPAGSPSASEAGTATSLTPEFIPGQTSSGNAATKITVLYTNDEQGWMEGAEPGQGAANLVGVWQQRFGYTPDGPFVILSGGDMWTGAAISTWYEGQSMVEVMNAMHYNAAALGNHEFDFGLDGLAERAGEMQFPLLAANLVYRADGSRPTDLGIQPYTIFEVDGVRVAVIGLITTLTPGITFPKYTGGFQFEDYKDAVEKVLPEIEAQEPDLVLVAAHVCVDELVPLAHDLRESGIRMLGGGHCEEIQASVNDGILILEAGHDLETYGYATFSADSAGGTFELESYGTAPNIGGAAYAPVEDVVQVWHDRSQADLDTPIGYLSSGMDSSSATLRRMIVETWLAELPNAEIALTNLGGIRDGLRGGEITVSDVISILPFDDTIVQIELTGRELRSVMFDLGYDLAAGGLVQSGNAWLFGRTGVPLDPDRAYTVLINNFMYTENYPFLGLDPNGYDTGILYRQPVIDWIRAQGSDSAHPIDAKISELVK
jgi:5'-nucleotidase/UDP-sugar diphosphatase